MTPVLVGRRLTVFRCRISRYLSSSICCSSMSICCCRWASSVAAIGPSVGGDEESRRPSVESASQQRPAGSRSRPSRSAPHRYSRPAAWSAGQHHTRQTRPGHWTAGQHHTPPAQPGQTRADTLTSHLTGQDEPGQAAQAIWLYVQPFSFPKRWRTPDVMNIPSSCNNHSQCSTHSIEQNENKITETPVSRFHIHPAALKTLKLRATSLPILHSGRARWCPVNWDLRCRRLRWRQTPPKWSRSAALSGRWASSQWQARPGCGSSSPAARQTGTARTVETPDHTWRRTPGCHITGRRMLRATKLYDSCTSIAFSWHTTCRESGGLFGYYCQQGPRID